MAKILFAGESWMSYSINTKGFNAYNIGGYGEGGKPLIDALEQMGHEVTYLRNHEAIEQFPRTVEELQEYDVVILSDIGFTPCCPGVPIDSHRLTLAAMGLSIRAADF